MNRRHVLAAGAATALALARRSSCRAQVAGATDAPRSQSDRPCKFGFNTATLRGMKLPLDRLVDIAATAGYSTIEPWVDEIRRYQQVGGKLVELKKRIADRGLEVVSAIGFARWLVDDPRQRAKGLEMLRRDMDLVRQIGGCRIAAPPAGATSHAVPLPVIAERYAEVLKIGAAIGVCPQLELWGSSKTLCRIGEVAYVAAECGRADSGLLLDVFHVYKGGSDFVGLKYLNGWTLHVFHMNDYPRQPPRNQVKDAQRVFPGDGVAPITQILSFLFGAGFRGTLSIELFNPTYWTGDPAAVAARGLDSMRRAVANCVK